MGVNRLPNASKPVMIRNKHDDRPRLFLKRKTTSKRQDCGLAALREIASPKKAVAGRSWGGEIVDTACQEYLEQDR